MQRSVTALISSLLSGNGAPHRHRRTPRFEVARRQRDTRCTWRQGIPSPREGGCPHGIENASTRRALMSSLLAQNALPTHLTHSSYDRCQPKSEDQHSGAVAHKSVLTEQTVPGSPKFESKRRERRAPDSAANGATANETDD